MILSSTQTNGCCRESQIYEMTKLIDNYRGSDLVILCGDFNTGDSHPAYRLLTTYLGLKASEQTLLKQEMKLSREDLYSSDHFFNGSLRLV